MNTHIHDTSTWMKVERRGSEVYCREGNFHARWKASCLQTTEALARHSQCVLGARMRRPVSGYAAKRNRHAQTSPRTRCQLIFLAHNQCIQLRRIPAGSSGPCCCGLGLTAERGCGAPSMLARSCAASRRQIVLRGRRPEYAHRSRESPLWGMNQPCRGPACAGRTRQQPSQAFAYWSPTEH